ncbi:ribonuclease HII [Paraburkholderia guartelaensis]|uniref:Ribonuclease HII n=1 Tax=Paraburkholderia guartelaensis TaxID=2546446 RepID=A0A4R5LIR5_9BURK|nr:ribonuclease HII [Paraburkholderia guartelaensis]TDG09419.1 ribonuclease HII [Paraburkholderia guartelaensis]
MSEGTIKRATRRTTAPAEKKPPSQAALKLAARRKAARQAGLVFGSPDDVICGVDEAGRGPLAGPVVAAAVILDPARPIRGLNDSKVLTAQARESLYERIVERSLAWCVASASVEEIDSLNILHATMLAMRRAVEGLSIVPTLAKIDGNRCPVMPVRSEAVIGGDALVPSISAASIIAKVTRDRMLVDLHQRHPHYGFDAHAGYGTPQHLEALRAHGPCEHHRRTFAPVREAYVLHGIVLPGASTVVSDVASLEEGDAFAPLS